MRSARPTSTFSRSTAVALLCVPALALGLAAAPAAAVAPAPSTPPVSATSSTVASVNINRVHAATGKYFYQDGVVDQVRDLLYVADGTTDPSIVRIDLATGASTVVPLAGDGPATDIAVSPLDGTVYATIGSGDNPAVAVVDPSVAYSAANLPPLVSLGSTRSPQKIEVGADGRVYVAHFGPAAISVIGASTGPDRLAVVQTIDVEGSGGGATAVDQETGLLYYVLDSTQEVTVVDTTANPASVEGAFALASKPLGAVWDAVADQLVVTTDNNTVAWVEPAADSASAVLRRTEGLAPLPAGAADWSAAYSLTVQPDGTALVLTEVFGDALTSFVSVVPPVVSDVTPVFPVAVGLDGMSLIPDDRAGGTAYVVNSGDGTVSTLTGVTLTSYSTTSAAGSDGIATAALTRADKRPLAAELVFTDSSDIEHRASTDAAGVASASIPGLPLGSADFDVSVAAPAGIGLTGRSSILTAVSTSATTLALDTTSIDEGAPVEGVVEVALSSGTATGVVTIEDADGTVFGTATLAEGAASVSISRVPVGTTELVARFAGTTSVVTPSESLPVTITVGGRDLVAHSAVTSGSVGGTFDVDLAGFLPNEDVVVTMHSEPVVLGTAAVDSIGSGTLTATVPDIAAGEHRVVAVGVESGRTSEFAFTVRAAAAAGAGAAGLASTGADLLGALTGGSILLALGLLASVAARAARRRSA